MNHFMVKPQNQTLIHIMPIEFFKFGDMTKYFDQIQLWLIRLPGAQIGLLAGGKCPGGEVFCRPIVEYLSTLSRGTVVYG